MDTEIGNPSNITFSNSYYTETLYLPQGTQSRSIVAGANADFTLAFAGDVAEYNVSEITTNGTGLQFGDVLYAGHGDNVSLGLTAPAGYVIVSATYTPEGGTATEIIPVGGVYSFTMPDADVTINAIAVAGATQTTTLAAGTNWWSTNLDITLEDLLAVLVEALPGTTNIVIQSKAQSTTYNGSRWRGQLSALDVANMYKITVTADCEITLTGMPINPAEHPVSIPAGQIVWIGFPFSEGMTPADAFAGFAVSGDEVSSKSQSTAYNGSRWRGQLNSLEPGKGYIYKSAATEDRTFTYPAR